MPEKRAGTQAAKGLRALGGGTGKGTDIPPPNPPTCFCSDGVLQCELCILDSLERGIQDALSIIREDPMEAAVKLQGFMIFDHLRLFVRNAYALMNGYDKLD